MHCAGIRSARLQRILARSTRKITREFVELCALAHRFEFKMRGQSALPQDF
jgi:hypothetical protein